MKFDKTSRYLIERCGVLSWLSSLISNTHKEHKGVLKTQLEIVNGVVTSMNTSQWLETNCVEQLTQLTHHLCVLFTHQFEVVKEMQLVDSVLEVICSTLKISEKRREVFQPHLRFSIEGVYGLFEAVNACCCNGELGLEVVLMTTPQPGILTMVSIKIFNLKFEFLLS